MQLLHQIGQKAILLVVFFPLIGKGQLPLYDNPDAIKKVKEATARIYSWEWDSVNYYIDEVRSELPDHPVVPLLEAIHTLWYHIPVMNDSIFEGFSQDLLLSAQLASEMPKDNPEAIYFEMAAKGLLAEYLAERGQYMKAFGQAKNAYFHLKDGFELADEVPDFLFAIGLYNYFIEVYPEKNSFFKPLVWFFKSGDPELGIQQLDEASKEAVLVDIEASIYLAYIYLRYEETPIEAQKYIQNLLTKYPNNLYLNAKLLESFNDPEYYDSMPDSVMLKLSSSTNNYYKLAGATFSGIVAQYVIKDPSLAKDYFEKAIEFGESLDRHGEYYKSYAYYELGLIYKENGEQEKAKKCFEESLTYAEIDELKKKVKAQL